MDESVQKVLEAAIMAPSGENAQPWHFVVHRAHRTIDVFVSADRDQSLYGWGNRASYVAIGAALENMRIAASDIGLSAHIELLPNPSQELFAARVTLAQGASRDPFADQIIQRTTNRKPYDKKPLTETEQRVLFDATTGLNGTLKLFTGRADIKALAEVGSTNELIMLNNPILHSFFFSHINWTKEEDMKKKAGFFIDTLELPPPARMGFRVMSNWSRARFLNQYLGFNTFIAKQNAALYATASAIGVVVSPNESAHEALASGMFVERMWLAATAQGLSIQPLTGVLYWTLRARSGVVEGFSDKEQASIARSYEVLDRIAGIGSGTSYFMFRIGHADAPTARAVRFALADVTTV